MIVIERKTIHSIPVLEIVDSDKSKEKLPLAVFFHGITNQKEQGLEPGYEMAKQGMRVIIPDAFLHGERKAANGEDQDALQFWNIVWHSLEELPYLVDHYRTKKLVSPGRVYVTGLSMGAITTCMALAKYPWIRAGASLMGTPDPIGFTNWIMTSHWMENVASDVKNDITASQIDQMMEPFKAFSLQAMPEKLAGRPFYIWHGTADQSVPYDHMRSFVDQIEGEEYAENVTFESLEGQGHKVPYPVFERMATFIGNV